MEKVAREENQEDEEREQDEATAEGEDEEDAGAFNDPTAQPDFDVAGLWGLNVQHVIQASAHAHYMAQNSAAYVNQLFSFVQRLEGQVEQLKKDYDKLEKEKKRLESEHRIIRQKLGEDAWRELLPAPAGAPEGPGEPAMTRAAMSSAPARSALPLVDTGPPGLPPPAEMPVPVLARFASAPASSVAAIDPEVLGSEQISKVAQLSSDGLYHIATWRIANFEVRLKDRLGRPLVSSPVQFWNAYTFRMMVCPENADEPKGRMRRQKQTSKPGEPLKGSLKLKADCCDRELEYKFKVGDHQPTESYRSNFAQGIMSRDWDHVINFHERINKEDLSLTICVLIKDPGIVPEAGPTAVQEVASEAPADPGAPEAVA